MHTAVLYLHILILPIQVHFSMFPSLCPGHVNGLSILSNVSMSECIMYRIFKYISLIQLSLCHIILILFVFYVGF